MTEQGPVTELPQASQPESGNNAAPAPDTSSGTDDAPLSPRAIEAQRVLDLARVKQEFEAHLKAADLGKMAISVLILRYERGQRTAANAQELVLSIYEGLRQKRDARSFSLRAVQAFAEQKGYFKAGPELEVTGSEVVDIAT